MLDNFSELFGGFGAATGREKGLAAHIRRVKNSEKCSESARRDGQFRRTALFEFLNRFGRTAARKSARPAQDRQVAESDGGVLGKAMIEIADQRFGTMHVTGS